MESAHGTAAGGEGMSGAMSGGGEHIRCKGDGDPPGAATHMLRAVKLPDGSGVVRSAR